MVVLPSRLWSSCRDHLIVSALLVIWQTVAVSSPILIPEMTEMTEMNAELLSAAEAATGFMPAAEGLGLFDAAARYARRGPVLESGR